MTTSTKTLYCRRCNGLPERIVEEGKRDLARCPQCGVVSDHEEAVQMAKEYFARSFGHSEYRKHQQKTTAAFKGSKNVSYLPGKIPILSSPDFIFR